jgi:hypothetical protein
VALILQTNNALKRNWKIILAITLGTVEVYLIFVGITNKVSAEHDAAMQAELDKINELPSVKPSYDQWQADLINLNEHNRSLTALNFSAANSGRKANPWDESVERNNATIKKSFSAYVAVYTKADNEIRQRYAKVSSLAGQDQKQIASRVLFAALLPICTLICGAYVLRRENPAYTFFAIAGSISCQVGSARMMFQNVVDWSHMIDYAIAVAVGFACTMLVVSRWANMDRQQHGSVTITHTHTITVEQLPRDEPACVNKLAELEIAGQSIPDFSWRKVARHLNAKNHSPLYNKVKERKLELQRKVA